MNQAFVKNPEHNIDRQQCRQNQHRLVIQRILKYFGSALKTAMNTAGNAYLHHHLINRQQRIAERLARRQIKRNGRSSKLALVIYSERHIS